MASEAPPFWWDKPNWRAYGLAPLSWIYGAVAVRRLLKAEPPKVPAPVLCIGNFTVGGAGKTPTAIAFAKAAKERGLHPGIVSRGYGGNYKGLHIVDPSADSARHVGDEPLLLARHAPVALCPDRLKSALELHQRGCDFIIMDDGFQSARLHTDFSLLVVDSTRGIGNGKVIPAGPLRAPLTDQMRKTDAVLRSARVQKPILLFDRLRVPGVPSMRRSCSLHHRLTLQAIAGWLLRESAIRPSFRKCAAGRWRSCGRKTFPDHYSYQPDDIAKLIETAEKLGVGLITTAKDHVRLVTMSDVPNAFIRNLAVLDVDLAFERKDAIGRILDTAIERSRSARFRAHRKVRSGLRNKMCAK